VLPPSELRSVVAGLEDLDLLTEPLREPTLYQATDVGLDTSILVFRVCALEGMLR
jgi:hypothetical protein